MSMPEPINPYDSPGPVKQGMSGGTKVLLGVGIGCGVLALLCCGGLGIGGFFVARNVQQAVRTEPDAVIETTKRIVAIEIPEPLKPEMAIDQLSIPFVGTMNMATWTQQEGPEAPPKSALVLFELDNKTVTQEMLKAQFEMQMQQSGQHEMKEVSLESSEVIEQEIGGKAAQFTFGKGKQPHDNREVWQATGAFDGKGGVALLFMQLEAASFTEEQARAIIASMH